LIPDLPRALHEIGRVSTDDARLAIATFAEGPNDPRTRLKRWLNRRFGVHFVPFNDLGAQLAAEGFRSFEWSLPGGWFGYASAVRDATGRRSS
jgi:hypothetical protein